MDSSTSLTFVHDLMLFLVRFPGPQANRFLFAHICRVCFDRNSFPNHSISFTVDKFLSLALCECTVSPKKQKNLHETRIVIKHGSKGKSKDNMNDADGELVVVVVGSIAFVSGMQINFNWIPMKLLCVSVFCFSTLSFL